MTKNNLTCLAFALSISTYVNAQSPQNIPVSNSDAGRYKMQPIHLQSRWAKDVNPNNALKEYPRPQMIRSNWENLNGLWQYAITDLSESKPINYSGYILVPYPVESALSGVQKKLMPNNLLWYKRSISKPKLNSDERLFLHFDAVDWKATIYVNGKEIGEHTGGYQNFSFDITDYLKSGQNELIVKVFDPTDMGPNPHGKQVLRPANIYYTPSSGIWQTVWLETVPAKHIIGFKTTPDIDKEELTIDINTTPQSSNLMLEVSALKNGKVVSVQKQPISGSKGVDKNTTSMSLKIHTPDLWSPDNPFLYDLSIKLLKGNTVIDKVTSYFGMRKIDIQKDEKGADRIFLNNKYTYNLGVLDQGFWPEGLYTAPTDEALAFDIKAMKSMGFNTIRKHIKIEPNRWYYHADKIGVLVWQDFVNPPHGLPEGSREIFEKEAMETMDQLHNYPSVITWVLFNERWGAYDQKRLTEWVKKYDPSRIVNGHSGELLYVNDELREPADSPWVNSDLTDVHSYPDPRNAPGQPGKARVLGEFGGVGVSVPGHQWDDMQGWGYVQVPPSELKKRYTHMMSDLKKLESEGLSGSIYTEPYDVEGEENGLLTYDREIVKIPVSEIREINNNIVPQISAGLDPKFFIAENINTKDNDDRYTELLLSYEKGKRDSVFLRRLLLMAARKKDQVHITNIGREYINQLIDPYSKENLTFINQITRTTKDKGFEMLMSNSEKVDAVLGENTSIYKLKAIISADDLNPYMAANYYTPNWDSLQQAFQTKYGTVGEELILGKRMYYYGTVTKDWKNYGKYFVLYFEKALHHPDFMINNVAWALFENVNDPKILSYGAEVMKYCIETWDKQAPDAFDTYANLLHKSNQSGEAIKWEEKALQMKKGAPDEKVYAETLQKMKSGQPTWPTNN
ncbi:MAG: glycoside hydrolase family 2 [Chitinophaga sp.]|uniref:sugar-binding domain-containing protein n=1 Tax=Chitinophaga sp. TaxID=1869181 RepID=UPI001B159D7B|nr:sugar-binding domain-containing protein [Chitinophaga sp.]MBO9727323.1 glycoside hydrolase family 2 [Chitinophaga sp.]